MVEYENKLSSKQTDNFVEELSIYLNGIPTMSVGSYPLNLGQHTNWGQEKVVVDYGSTLGPREGKVILKIAVRDAEGENCSLFKKIRELLQNQGIESPNEGNRGFSGQEGTKMLEIECF